MGHLPSRVTLAVGAVLVGTCVAVAGCSEGEPIAGPVAAVMDAKGAVVLVDLERGEVLETVKLRSWAGDIAAVPGAGAFVTAQSGGVGPDADDAVGVIRIRSERRVSYVGLPRPNPLGVKDVGGGLVLVDHGWMDTGGMFACLVDIDSMRVARLGRIPDNNEPVAVAGGYAWSSGVDVLTDRPSLRRVDTRTLESTVVLEPRSPRNGRRSIECATQSALFGWIRVPGKPSVLARYEAVTGSLDATAAVEFVDGPGRLVSVGDRLVACDFTGEDLARPEGGLAVFDSVTMRQERAIRLSGVPSDVAVWRERVVVANHRDQTVRVVDPATGVVETTVRLPKLSGLPLRLAVLD